MKDKDGKPCMDNACVRCLHERFADHVHSAVVLAVENENNELGKNIIREAKELYEKLSAQIPNLSYTNAAIAIAIELIVKESNEMFDLAKRENQVLATRLVQ